MEEIEYKIWFSRLEISNKYKLKLLYDFEKLEIIWNLNRSELEENGYLNQTITEILNESKRVNLEEESRIINKEKIKILFIKDKEYPKRLLDIPDCPAMIYLKGNIEKIYEDNIAIIGSRHASDYGKEVARKISKEFSNLNINVVSGLASGIDKYAHLGALDGNNGNTIAVLGNGLYKELLYPKENLKVYERIIDEGGLIISEYSFFENAKQYYFPMRNRIISGISNKILVVEAEAKSGTMITVDYALEQGKDVFAVPGNIDRSNSKGTNKLIQNGAIPFLSINDVFI